MSSKLVYPNIDMRRTGKRIKYMIETAGYTPRMIQEYLHLSCVQPIYRWYKGTILPSVDHLFMLSELLNVHMEEFLVKDSLPVIIDIEQYKTLRRHTRFMDYHNMIYSIVS